MSTMRNMSGPGAGRVTVDYKNMRIYTPGQYRPGHLRPTRKPYVSPSKKWIGNPRPPRLPGKQMQPMPEALPHYRTPTPGRRIVPLIKLPKKSSKILRPLIPAPLRFGLRALDIITQIPNPWVKTPDQPGGYDWPAGWTDCGWYCPGDPPTHLVGNGAGCNEILMCLITRPSDWQVAPPAYYEYGETFTFDFSGYAVPTVTFKRHLGDHATYWETFENVRNIVYSEHGDTIGEITVPYNDPVPGVVIPVQPEMVPTTRTGTMSPGSVADTQINDPILRPKPGLAIAPDTGSGYSGNGPTVGPQLPPYADPALHYPEGGRPTPGHHNNVPDSSKKLKINYGPLGNLYGGITEIGDLADAIAPAIPGDPCKNAKGLHQKWACIFAHAGQIDWGVAGVNILKNQLQDQLIGKLGKFGKNAVSNAANRGYYGSPVGLSTGGSFTRPPAPRMVNL